MIVVDENLHDQRIMWAISAWYPGQVVSVTTLRPRTVIKDEAIPALLLKVVQPTFVTINAADFWKRVQPHNAYCIVAVALPKGRMREVPTLLRRLFRRSHFKTKASRMGKVIRLTPNRIEYFHPPSSAMRQGALARHEPCTADSFTQHELGVECAH